MTKELGKGDYVTAVKNPLLGKCVAVAVNSGSLHSPAFIVVVESGIAGAFNELLTIDITEKVVVRGLMLSVF